MRTTCLVNNYNYREFVCEAVDSALEQTLPFNQIVIVDDGSTDESVWRLRQQYTNASSVEIVVKENGGQLSAFNRGLESATGDVVFFLDADDRFRPNYVEQAVELYDSRDVDFAIAGVESFGPALTRQRKRFAERDLGYSTISSLLTKAYVGGPTSALSMRLSIAQQILPCPFEAEWRTRADDVLVLGSSIVGARKYQMGSVQVDYRVHGGNNFSGRQANQAAKLRHGLAVNRLVAWYAERMGYSLAELPAMLHREFQTIERPTFGEWRHYTRMSWSSRIPLLVRARHFGETTEHYWRERLTAPLAPAAETTAEEPGEILSLPDPAEYRRAA